MESNNIVYGEALAGRNVPVTGIEDMIAPCFTTVPIRVDIDHRQSVGQYLNQVQEDSAAMISFQHRGLQSLRRLGPDIHESLELNNLFEVHDGAFRQSDDFLVEIQDKQLLKGFFDSYAVVMECILVDRQTVKIEARYDANVLDNWQMERLCGHFRHVANQLCTVGHDETLYDIEIISPEDMATIKSWNERDDMQCVESTIQEIFAEQVRLRPQALAISGWDGEMRYEELDDLSTLVAQILMLRGIGREDIVPMCFEKSKWAIVAMLGILKAGGAVAQLGISHPLGQKRDVLQDTDAKLIITSRQQQALFEGLIDVLVIDQESIYGLAREESQLPQVRPSDAAYVLFTSGSTGRSKGIVVEHLNICTSSRHHGAHMGINAGTRVFQFAAYTFDISCADIFTSLQRGATVCIPSEEERVNDLPGAITKYCADWVFLTPTVAQMVSPTSVPTLRTLALGGEAPTEDNIKTWSNHLRLILIWGPAETTIYATSTPPITIDTSPTVLGSAMGCHLWLCEPENHNRLTPVGCVGEILVEGGLVSRGYLKNKIQTTASYLQDAPWGKVNSSDNKSRRMYKTGDLARWGADGILRYVGRKDNQVKLHGQRFELEDVEHRILRHTCVRHAVARIPRKGPLKDKLVAILDYHNNPGSQNTKTSANSSGTETPTPLSSQGLEAVEADLSKIRQVLEDTLPSYQCPSVWINVESIPLSINGKINKKAVNIWLEEMDQENFELLIQGSSNQLRAIPSTREAQALETLVGRVLNIQNPNPKQSFLSLGGDSITAMQLRAKARAEGIDLTVQDILKSKSLLALAATVKSSATTLVKRDREEIGALFSLSPIQKLFCRTATSTKHFNQSFILKVNSTTLPSQLEVAIETLVSRHSMLRARFHTSDGTWFQSITDEIQDSFRFRVDEVDSRSQVDETLRQRKDLEMDIGNGPLLDAHLFQVAQGKEQLIFLSAHHLVVDLVSWRIILNDLQELLVTGTLSSEPPLSFQDWLYLQKEHIRSLNTDSVLPPRAPDFGYWGMDGQPNIFGDISTNDLNLSETLTAKIFGSSNLALNTEPVDIILAAVIHSFQCVFTDREVPPVFIEGHGRETWSNDVDPNGTVGWFTTMSPLHIASTQSEIVQVVRATKDLRRKTGGHMPYLSSLFATKEDGQEQPENDSRVELIFNYLGKYQQLESKNAFFSQVELEGNAVTASQFNSKLERFSLIDISVVVTHGQARISFTHNKKMRHQDKLQRWTSIFEDSIICATEALDSMNQQRTVSDFPLLPNLDEGKLASIEKRLAASGISMDNVQDIFPCAPLQQHMIDAQEQDQGSGLYEVNVYQQVLAGRVAPFNAPVNIRVLQEAWKKVVDYHAILRTVFMPSSLRPGQHDQAVLSSYPADIPVITCGDEKDLLRRIKSYKSLDCHDQTTSEKRPHHRFTLFTTADGQKTACKLEISHALIDGMSVSVLFRDLATAYRGRLATRQGSEPYFGDYVAWLARQTTNDSVKYWRQLIDSSYHSFADSPKRQQLRLRPQRREQKFLNVPLDPTLVAVIPSFCQIHGVTVATFFQTVWGLILRQCLGHSEDTPLFGYMVANRDAAVHEAEDIVGPMTAMLLCRAECKPTTRVGDLLRRTQGEVLEAMQHQSALADAVRDIEMEDANGIEDHRRKLNFCNSVMSLQYIDAGADLVPRRAAAGPPRMKIANGEPLRAKHAKKNASIICTGSQMPASDAKDSDIQFRLLGYHDPNEYDMSVGVQVVRSGSRIENNLKINVGFAYWTDALRDAKARSIVKVFQRCAEELIENGSNGLRIWMLMRRLG
jgi:amino acid adenylation domain-containing protein